MVPRDYLRSPTKIVFFMCCGVFKIGNVIAIEKNIIKINGIILRYSSHLETIWYYIILQGIFHIGHDHVGLAR